MSLYPGAWRGRCTVAKGRGGRPRRRWARRCGALLNMGHTIGHAVEKLKDFSLLHGQCVSIGCAASVYLSWKKGWISKEEYGEIKEQLQAFALPVKVQGLGKEEVLKTTKSDKKMAGGQIRFILLRAWGDAVIDTTLTDEELLEGIQSILTEEKA